MDKQEAGFTLIEVLIAMIIMGISFSILVEGFVEVNTGIENNRDYSYLSFWAESKINKLATGIELNNHGSFRYKDEFYDWWVEEKYVDENINKLILNIEWDGKRGRKKYSLSRLVIQFNRSR